jgi:SsrA-binding protein
MKKNENIIISNKKAAYLYTVLEHWEAGMVLEGWEVKAIRNRRVQITESYVYVKNHEVFILNMLINPLVSTSTHTPVIAARSRKLLLSKKQIYKLEVLLSRKGHTAIPLNLHWKGQHIKMQLAIATGKTQYDKRQRIREREWKNKGSWE